MSDHKELRALCEQLIRVDDYYTTVPRGLAKEVTKGCLSLLDEQRPRELPYQLLHGETKHQNTILKAENKRLREALEPWAEIARKHLREHPHGEYRLHDDPLWDCHALLVAQMIFEERR